MKKSSLTLTELTGMIGKALGESFPGKYWLIAEINEIRENVSGHCYLELVEKDPGGDNILARCRATIWAYTWRMLKPYFETSTSRSLEKGMMILVEVTVEFHELYGISLNIKDVDPVYTLGDLEKRRAEIIRQLEEEGIINMNKSLDFPILPSCIAVISSPVAAGYEDFIHQIENNRKNYRLEITLFPALMQGKNAGKSVTNALDAVFETEDRFDVVIILRGGGSGTDLNCFNTYEIASHVAQFPIPVITGIGHERDHTVTGMVSHTDLKTPTAVAEFLIDWFGELDQILGNLGNRISKEATRILRHNREFLDSAGKNLPNILKNNLYRKYRHLNSTGSILARSAVNFIHQNRHKLILEHSHFGFVLKNCLLRLKNKQQEFHKHLFPGSTRYLIRKESERLELFNKSINLNDPQNIIKKGYTVTIRNGRVIKNAKDVSTGDMLETIFHDGRIHSKTIKIDTK